MTTPHLRGANDAEAARRAIATIYMTNQDANAALARLQSLTRQHPDNLAIMLDLSSVALRCAEYGLAREYALKLLAIEPQSLTIVDRATETLNAMGMCEPAWEAWLNLMQGEHRATALTALAGMALRKNSYAEAEAFIQRAITISSSNPMTLLIAGQLAANAGRFDEAERLLSECSTENVEPLARFRAFYALGDLYDRLDEPALAVAQWRLGKRCTELEFPEQVKRCRKLREIRLQRNRDTMKALPTSAYQKWRQTPASPYQPSFAILAGHPRSGTTLLEQVIASHPAVVDMDEKDAMNCSLQTVLRSGYGGYLPFDTISMAATTLQGQVRNDYLRRVAMLHGRLPKSAVVLDKNPNLTDALPLLLPFFPGLKMLIARRDPKDILLSCFRLAVTPDASNVGWLQEQDAVQDYQSMMSVWEQLRDLLQPNDGWLEVDYEKLCSDFWGTAQTATQFLDLDWHADQANYRETRINAQVNSPTFAEVAQPVNLRAIGRWRRYADLLPELFAAFVD